MIVILFRVGGEERQVNSSTVSLDKIQSANSGPPSAEEYACVPFQLDCLSLR